MIKTREFKESNYRAIWFNSKTIRIALDPTKPITELKFPEFYDIKLTGHCKGNCPWCYMDSKETDEHYTDVVQKIKDYFEPMSENERCFQVAIGGGEPTSHPDFIEVLMTFKELGIEPNYTTNGMFINPDNEMPDENEQAILDATKKYCGGVAVSCHPHLIDYWNNAASEFYKNGIRLNFHLIISDKKSIDYFKEIYDAWNDKVDYFVLLPYGNQGRAENKEIDWEYLITKLPENQAKIAFGANFYPYLMKGNHGIKVSLYEPEIMSKFLDLKDMKLYPSSFNLI
jgi:organic radical activating enzyme